MNYKSYHDLEELIKNNVSLLQSSDYDLIVGIPRSGMIAAYMIANYLNKDCCDIGVLTSNSTFETTRYPKGNSNYPSDAKNILIVDDCIASGNSLSNSLNSLREFDNVKITTLCIYSSEKVRNDVDLFFEYLPSPRIFEWHIYHCVITKKSCFNIDGVLCMSPTTKQKNDDEKYLEFLLNTSPLFIPSEKINYIITSRPEKYRNETETWLKNNGVQYDSLIMFKKRFDKGCPNFIEEVNYKARVYKKSKQELLYEEDRNQAVMIHRRTKKPVFCVGTNEMFSKGILISAIYGSRYSKNLITDFSKEKLQKIPIFYSTMRAVYRIINNINKPSKKSLNR
ncbi:phosphoribosyltransferase family protein [Salipaludibacillus sp. HK11]|uniref:phosphoribosyltransferase family protein n=1 Tax=Salipaludibacillus sp. HK11 TaxID=3394320 RepID=UPI0039FD3DBB